jgi:hypothetical protein
MAACFSVDIAYYCCDSGTPHNRNKRYADTVSGRTDYVELHEKLFFWPNSFTKQRRFLVVIGILT